MSCAGGRRVDASVSNGGSRDGLTDEVTEESRAQPLRDSTITYAIVSEQSSGEVQE